MLGEENENNYPEKVKKEKVRKRQF